MQQERYLPEGFHTVFSETQFDNRSTGDPYTAWERGSRIDGIATLCDENRALHVRFWGEKGIIPREEAGLGADVGTLKDIAVLSRVGQPVCFRIIGKEGDHWILSRRSLQEEAHNCFMKNLRSGAVLEAKVTHLEQFGAFVDIGCGLISMIGIEHISVSRIRSAKQRFFAGQEIKVAVLRIDCGSGRIDLTHKELLGTWEENAAKLTPGCAVRGIVRSIKRYGAFIELTPNLSGLSEPGPGLEEEMQVVVYIRSILPEKMKIKLSVADRGKTDGVRFICSEDYHISSPQLRVWRYPPESCITRQIETDFSGNELL
ncbi:MAG: 30S ribosomal protein S1 [Clostridia bacterium]|nr:30S ribosomal protein S1 [Clostridia bacterium]